jgi:hypothetical protein
MRTKPLASGAWTASALAFIIGGAGTWWGLGCATADGAIVAWGTPANVAGVGDVSLLGALVEAVNTGIDGNSVPTTVAVNGVTFLGWSTAGGSAQVSPGGHFSITAAAGFTHQGFDGFGSFAAPFSNLPTDYKTLLRGGNYVSNQLNANDFTGAITLAISGLTVGVRYEFQWWTNDSRPFSSGPVIATSGGASVALDPNVTNGTGGVGQFATGTFTADAPTQTVVFTTTGNANLQSAFQLRIPEPSSALLFATAFAVLGGCWRRRRTG